MTKLCIQYQQSEAITMVKAKDDSEIGIRLPNATVCILFKNRMNKLRVNINEFNFTHFSNINLDKAILLSRLFNQLDYETLNFKVWKDVEEYVKLETLPNVVKKMQHDKNFWNRLAKVLCDLISVRLSTIDSSKTENRIELCKLTETGSLPFTANSELMLCFRIPLDIVAIKSSQQNEYDYFRYSTHATLNSADVYLQDIILQFQPLALRMYFPNFDDVMSVFLFFPEDPMSYSELEGKKLMSPHKKRQFIHRLEYANSFNYMTATVINVDVSVSAKYTPQGASDNCANVYNETKCLVNCLEEELIKFCNCNRFTFRHFIDRSDDIGYCNSKDYEKCFDNYKIRRFHSTDDKQECVKKCYKCAKIIFQSQINEKQIDWKSELSDQKMTCDAYQRFMNKTGINCYHFWNNVKVYLPYLTDGMTYGKERVTFSNEKFNPVFGLVKYKFKVTSFTYPEFIDRVSITNEEFKSQIGGIFGLYLGFSGMTIFALLTKCVQLCKCRCKKRQKITEKRSFVDGISLLFSLAQIPDAALGRSTVNLSPRQTVNCQACTSLFSQEIADWQDNFGNEIINLKCSMSVLSNDLANLKSEIPYYRN